MNKKRKAMVRWTDGEVKKLARLTADELLGTPGLTIPAAMNQALESFKKERRRVITGLQNLPEGMYEMIKTNMSSPSAPEIKIVKLETLIPADIGDIETDRLAVELVKRIMLPAISQTGQIMSANVIKAIRGEFSDIRNTLKGKPTRKEEEKEKRIKVLVIGLLPDQGNEINKDFKELLALTFMKDPPARQLKAKAANQDHTVLVTKFISHSVQDVVKKADTRVMLCHGGMTELRSALETIYLEGQE